MKIIANSYFLRNLRNLDFFNLDLGKTRRDINSKKFRKVDVFEAKYKTLYGNVLSKFGNIAEKIFFYEDVKIKNYNLVIFKGDDVYELEYDENDLVDIKNYILGTMREIDKTYQSEQEENQKIAEKIGDVWECNDEKNGKKTYMFDQTLTKEEYRNKMKEYMALKNKL